MRGRPLASWPLAAKRWSGRQATAGGSAAASRPCALAVVQRTACAAALASAVALSSAAACWAGGLSPTWVTAPRLPPQDLHRTLAPSYPLLEWVRAGVVPRSRGDLAARRARVDGDFGVLEEMDAPLVDLSEADDPIWERLTVAAQSADSKRGVDISAFWIRDGFNLLLVVTALSRPQIQAIGSAIRIDMKKKLGLKADAIPGFFGKGSVRHQASSGWLYMQYGRLMIHVFTPLQRSYYDLEGLWRDEYEDYEKVDVADILREETFGNLKLTNRIPPAPDKDDNMVDGGKYESPIEQAEKYEDVLPIEDDEDDLYEADEDDPFWS